jgi:threonine dehydratase
LLSERAPETEIFYVEPSGGKSLAAAVQAGAPVALAQVDTFVDGAAVAMMGVNTFTALKGLTRIMFWISPKIAFAPQYWTC